MKTAFVLLGALALAAGCRSEPARSGTNEKGDSAASVKGQAPRAEEAPEPGETSAEPARVWSDFVSAWNERAEREGAANALAAFRAASELVALDNPGAFVRVRAFGDAGALFALEGEYDLARVKKLRLRAELSPGDAPRPSCEDDTPKKGVFVVPVDRFQLDVRFDALKKYELASDAEVARLETPVHAARKNAQFAIYDLEQNVGFLFGFEGARPVLLALDAVIPCSA